jgi:hypothetical protein
MNVTLQELEHKFEIADKEFDALIMEMQAHTPLPLHMHV